MKAIDQLHSPVKDKVLSVYDQILRQGKLEGREKGKEEAAFTVFKNGKSMGLSFNQLLQLTGISENTASVWNDLLDENSDAEYREVGLD